MIVLSSFVSAMCLALVIFLTRPLHIQFTAKGHGNAAVQSSHRLPTPRIGGLAVILGGFFGAFTLDATTFHLVSILAISALPVFLGGLGEDVGFNVSAKMRLVLSFVSALIAGVLLGAWIPRMGVPVLELLTLYTFPAIILTLLVSGGISHSLNLIDGLNGLAIGVSIVIALGLMSIAVSVGDYQISYILLLIIGALLGLLVFNYPFGKLFLGDAGAYCTGHILAWIAILLLNRHPEIAPFSMLLVFFWPIADMIFSIFRRYRSGKPIDQPDRLHFHQLVMRALELTLLSRKLRGLTNPLATLIIVPLASVPIAAAVMLHNKDQMAAIGFIAAAMLFVITYNVGMVLAKRFARHGTRARS